MPPPDIPEYIIAALLRFCTTEAPFKCPQGKLFYQIDGIAMGSPLGVLFAQACMSSEEAEVLRDESIKPYMYYRYIPVRSKSMFHFAVTRLFLDASSPNLAHTSTHSSCRRSHQSHCFTRSWMDARKL